MYIGFNSNLLIFFSFCSHLAIQLPAVAMAPEISDIPSRSVHLNQYELVLEGFTDNNGIRLEPDCTKSGKYIPKVWFVDPTNPWRDTTVDLTMEPSLGFQCSPFRVPAGSEIEVSFSLTAEGLPSQCIPVLSFFDSFGRKSIEGSLYPLNKRNFSFTYDVGLDVLSPGITPCLSFPFCTIKEQALHLQISDINVKIYHPFFLQVLTPVDMEKVQMQRELELEVHRKYREHKQDLKQREETALYQLSKRIDNLENSQENLEKQMQLWGELSERRVNLEYSLSSILFQSGIYSNMLRGYHDKKEILHSEVCGQIAHALSIGSGLGELPFQEATVKSSLNKEAGLLQVKFDALEHTEFSQRTGLESNQYYSARVLQGVSRLKGDVEKSVRDIQECIDSFPTLMSNLADRFREEVNLWVNKKLLEINKPNPPEDVYELVLTWGHKYINYASWSFTNHNWVLNSFEMAIKRQEKARQLQEQRSASTRRVMAQAVRYDAIQKEMNGLMKEVHRRLIVVRQFMYRIATHQLTNFRRALQETPYLNELPFLSQYLAGCTAQLKSRGEQYHELYQASLNLFNEIYGCQQEYEQLLERMQQQEEQSRLQEGQHLQQRINYH